MEVKIPILETYNLKVERAGKNLLDIPHLTIEDREVLSLIGPNGAGKTTLLVSLGHLFKHFSGRIIFRGKEIDRQLSAGEYRKKIAMVFQEPMLFNSTVFENVSSGLRFRKMKRQEIEKIVMENLERFGIRHLSHRSARTLSGGEAQRVSLARAFAINPEIMMLDEPFSSLDPPTRDALIDDFEHILRQLKITTLFATHDRNEALRLSARIFVMGGGRIIQAGSPEDVMNHPCNEFVASFVGVETILSGVVAQKERGVITVSVSGRDVEAVGEVLVGERVLLCIRPEDVTLFPASSKTESSARNRFTGKVIKVVPAGPYNKVYLDCGFPLVAYITKASEESLAIETGKILNASFKATSVHVIKRG